MLTEGTVAAGPGRVSPGDCGEWLEGWAEGMEDGHWAVCIRRDRTDVLVPFHRTAYKASRAGEVSTCLRFNG